MPLPCLKSASRGCFQSFAGLREREIVVHKRIKTKKPIQIQKTKQKNNKQADKPKQNKTKIYKRMNEEYITHAQ